jgi:predicted dehydrogenase
MTQAVRVGIVGTSAIGRLHAELAAESQDVELVALSGLDHDAEAFAFGLGVALYRDFRDLAALDLDGVVVATPNHLHLEMGAFFAERQVNVLVEKPIADTVLAGKELCAAAARNGVHLLVGHQRRHNRLVKEAARLVSSEIGDLVASDTLALMRKPDSYYDLDWRRSAGAGPLMINLIHDVDLLRTVCGEIDHVQAVGRRMRGFDYDDTAVIILHYRSGAYGTVLISDSTPSPWNWEASVSEGLGLPTAGRDHSRFSGTEASLSFPSLTMWAYDPADGEVGWKSPLRSRVIEVEKNHPYADQLTNFAEVIRGEATPVVSGEDALRSLAVVSSVVRAARKCGIVDVDEVLASS